MSNDTVVWEKFTLKIGDNEYPYRLLGRYIGKDIILLENVGMQVNDELYNINRGVHYIIKEIDYFHPEQVCCKCKEKESYKVYIENNSGNISIGNNNNQKIYINNSFEPKEFIKEMQKYLIDKNVDFKSVGNIEKELEELAIEINKISNNKNGQNVNNVLNKLKDKAKDIPFDIIKDGIKECLKNVDFSGAINTILAGI